ncbi:hypothetical protein [Nonomuraea candida]|uniref:hypothetical protein n=1 Tax=Nonomuraea candida TaxID=359159 RepID=UPI0005BC5A58|nr:hypothetical protein [Nonomuraea candida]
MIVTVALLRAALTIAAAHDWNDPLPVMVSCNSNSWARPLASAIRFGHFKTVESDDHDVPVGRLTRNPSDGPLVAALTIAEPDHDPSDEDIAKAPTDVQLAANLRYAELINPAMPVVIPTERIADDVDLYAPLDPAMDYGYYNPDGKHHSGVWGHEPIDGLTVHVLWPLPARHATTPPTPIRPVDWLARLHQTETWTGWHGRTHRIRDLEFYDNCMARAWLEINAATITEGVIRHLASHPDPDTVLDGPGERTRLQEADIALIDPRAWIAESPLARALADVYAN